MKLFLPLLGTFWALLLLLLWSCSDRRWFLTKPPDGARLRASRPLAALQSFKVTVTHLAVFRAHVSDGGGDAGVAGVKFGGVGTALVTLYMSPEATKKRVKGFIALRFD